MSVLWRSLWDFHAPLLVRALLAADKSMHGRPSVYAFRESHCCSVCRYHSKHAYVNEKIFYRNAKFENFSWCKKSIFITIRGVSFRLLRPLLLCAKSRIFCDVTSHRATVCTAEQSAWLIGFSRILGNCVLGTTPYDPSVFYPHLWSS